MHAVHGVHDKYEVFSHEGLSPYYRQWLGQGPWSVKSGGWVGSYIIPDIYTNIYIFHWYMGYFNIWGVLGNFQGVLT